MSEPTQLADAPLVPVVTTEEQTEVFAEFTSINVKPYAVTAEEWELCRYVQLMLRYQHEMDRVTQACKQIVAQLGRKAVWLKQQYGPRASEITRAMIEDGSRSVKTPFGVAGFRRLPARLVVEDDQAVIEAVAAGKLPADCVTTRVTTSVAKSKLNELFAATGEVPPGCAVADSEDHFYVK